MCLGLNQTYFPDLMYALIRIEQDDFEDYIDYQVLLFDTKDKTFAVGTIVEEEDVISVYLTHKPNEKSKFDTKNTLIYLLETEMKYLTDVCENDIKEVSKKVNEDFDAIMEQFKKW